MGSLALPSKRARLILIWYIFLESLYQLGVKTSIRYAEDFFQYLVHLKTQSEWNSSNQHLYKCQGCKNSSIYFYILTATKVCRVTHNGLEQDQKLHFNPKRHNVNLMYYEGITDTPFLFQWLVPDSEQAKNFVSK